MEQRWEKETKKYKLDFMEKQEEDSPSEDEDNSDYGGSIDLSNTDGEDNGKDEDEEYTDEDAKHDDDGDEEMEAGESGSHMVDEDYEEFNNDNTKMLLQYYGKGTYTGGMADKEWNAWK